MARTFIRVAHDAVLSFSGAVSRLIWIKHVPMRSWTFASFPFSLVPHTAALLSALVLWVWHFPTSRTCTHLHEHFRLTWKNAPSRQLFCAIAHLSPLPVDRKLSAPRDTLTKWFTNVLENDCQQPSLQRFCAREQHGRTKPRNWYWEHLGRRGKERGPGSRFVTNLHPPRTLVVCQRASIFCQFVTGSVLSGRHRWSVRLFESQTVKTTVQKFKDNPTTKSAKDDGDVTELSIYTKMKEEEKKSFIPPNFYSPHSKDLLKVA